MVVQHTVKFGGRFEERRHQQEADFGHDQSRRAARVTSHVNPAPGYLLHGILFATQSRGKKRRNLDFAFAFLFHVLGKTVDLGNPWIACGRRTGAVTQFDLSLGLHGGGNKG